MSSRAVTPLRQRPGHIEGAVETVSTTIKSEPKTPSSIVIERVQPEIDGGRWPIKREVGDRLKTPSKTGSSFWDGALRPIRSAR